MNASRTGTATSRATYPLIDRGIANDYLTEHLMFGDRDIGVFNGMGKNTRELSLDGSKDVAARLQARPAKWLSVGVNGSVKFIGDQDLPGFVDNGNFTFVDPEEYPQGYDTQDFIREYAWMTGPRWMTGADLGLNLWGVKIVAEGLFGENWWFEKYPWAWSSLLTVSYKFVLHETWSIFLEPVVGGESDIDGSRRDGLWPNEWPGTFADSKRLMIQLAFAI